MNTDADADTNSEISESTQISNIRNMNLIIHKYYLLIMLHHIMMMLITKKIKIIKII
jgi:hypothetical protein